MTHVLKPKPLTKADFAPFGDVIETQDAHHYTINRGNTERYHDLATLDVTEANGNPLVNVFRGQPIDLPFTIEMMERHPLSSQAFIPLSKTPFLVLVAAPGKEPTADDLRIFISNGEQGVNYHRGTWHHYLLTLNQKSDFIVIDRGGPEKNCDEITFENSGIRIDLNN